MMEEGTKFSHLFDRYYALYKKVVKRGAFLHYFRDLLPSIVFLHSPACLVCERSSHLYSV